MRKDWLNTFAASLAVIALAGTSAMANPAMMAARRPAPKAPAAAVAPQAAMPPANALVPVETSAPSRNPVTKLGKSISKLSSKVKRGASPNPVMSPARQHDDAISLNTPTGAPTPKLFIAAAQLCESQGDNNLARNNYQEAMNRWPGDVEVLRAAARMEDRMGQLSIAENLYAKAVAANPGHAGALNDLGLCLARQGKLDASVQVIEQAIAIQPDKALYRNNAATVLVEMRQDKRALAHLAQVHSAADANYNFGQLLVQRNRAADATPYFQAAVDQNPDMQHARIALGKLRGDAGPTTTSLAPAASLPQTPAEQQTAPAAVPDNGPQLGYPATAARTNSIVPQNNVPTRYLPPVAARPSPVQR